MSRDTLHEVPGFPPMTARARNALEQAGITSLDQLGNTPEWELRRRKGVGMATLCELRAMVAEPRATGPATCASCKFHVPYVATHPDAGGACRRRAPQAMPSGQTEHPHVSSRHWCGEHETR